MKKIAIAILFCLSLLTSQPGYAQDNIAVGGLVGTSYYIGDFNPGRPFYMPSLYVGGLINYSITDYYNLRVSLGGGSLRGDPTTYKGKLMSNAPGQLPASFNTLFFNLDARLDVGFLPYDPFAIDSKKFRVQPYFTLGAGIAYSDGKPYMELPIGAGIKYRLFYRCTVGVEWIFDKTFNDNIDKWESPKTTSGFTLNNNDWISYVGIYITYQLSDKYVCPALK